MKISIIIPIYNGEKYLEECLESIRNQTYIDFEAILVNDGSTDGSKTICEKWEKQDARFILYNNKNCGVSYSRNFGIEKARGEYITFVDCDDFIEKDMLEILQRECLQYDFIMANYRRYYQNKKIVNNEPIETKTYNRKEFFSCFWDLYSSYMINSPCNRLYKTAIIQSSALRFNTDYELGEDLLFNLQYIENCNKFYVINEYLYYYRENKESLTTKYRDNYLEIQLKLNDAIEKFLIRNDVHNEESKKKLQKNTSNIIISSVQNLFLSTCKLNRKEVKQKLKEYLAKPEIEELKEVRYSEKRLQIFKRMIEKKKVRTIIWYSRIKEWIRKILK